ncbi:MAG: hypothetical protein IJY72_05665 [Akkermansia sp.]|nr:hypothetical protein [Akkermansia sp.]
MQLSGGLGNQLWQISAALVAGADAVCPDLSCCTPHAAWIARNCLQLPEPARGQGLRRLAAGYYQSLRYAAKPAEVLRHVRRVPAEVWPCVVHLRAGDYLHHPAYAATVPTAEMLRARVALLGVPDDEVLVVTDDPATAERLCPQWRCQSGSLLRDFWTLCGAQLLVMSSSTLSWWAGYAGQARRVIFPRLWPMDMGASAGDATCAACGVDLVFDSERCIIHE